MNRLLTPLAICILLAQTWIALHLPKGFYQDSFLLPVLLIALLAAAHLMSRLTALADSGRPWQRPCQLAVPTLFGLMILLVWEAIVRGYDVPLVLMPEPSRVFVTLGNNLPLLWADFQQTYLKAVLAGYLMGCGLGFVAAKLVVRSPFLQKGLLPLGNFMASIPIIGIAPIMVMWFGFDWQSKAAVVVVMTFFPMLINTVAGLRSVDPLHADLMHTYAAGKGQIFFKNQLPQAMPFIFNALKLNSTLALIGAIVAEFFGTPIVGMGFRISAEVGRMNMDMVWATIFVAALAGSLSYGALALLERRVTFWHPSVRRER
ncbi:Pyrimidine ABC transporter, transmembrane component 2 [Nitrincola lacisaponensis]|uniref:Pyrimidine ABC transporter, transmembrane component 2 n=1 Tax=Nitrincola lacisaponensis TaxID=267850 RepID=A0A063XY64_9GAMM|nr:ABC transporter permease [Nitrincola lacisaponensis]KDE38434.1 Pyrimidine ABC transporter, transmembrane component 2 [Nitrincola lacisaponensis]